jgi:hypothetical protein
MEKSHVSEADTRSDSQEIHCLFWNPDVHHLAHNSPPLGPLLVLLTL